MKRGPTGPELDHDRPSKRTSRAAADGATNAPIMRRFRCVKRAAVRDGYDQQCSQRTGFVEVGACVDALECRTTESGVVRVRFDGGWLSCTSQKGDVLLQPLAPVPPKPLAHGCRCCGKIGHLKARCPDKHKRCQVCGKVRLRVYLAACAGRTGSSALILNGCLVGWAPQLDVHINSTRRSQGGRDSVSKAHKQGQGSAANEGRTRC